MAEEDEGMAIPWSKVIPFTTKTFRYLKMGAAVAAVKQRVAHGTVAVLHRDVAHSIRDFAVCLSEPDLKVHVGHHAQAMVNALAKSMRILLELDPNELHCCYKVLKRSKGGTRELMVVPMARSQPFDDREVAAAESSRSLSESTIFAALSGSQRWHHSLAAAFLFLLQQPFEARGALRLQSSQLSQILQIYSGFSN